MTDQCSENSGCSCHLGTCIISSPEDIAVFEENLRNPKMAARLKKSYVDGIRSMENHREE